MKSFGSTLAILGILAIVLDFVNMVPKVLAWIYSWGGGLLWLLGGDESDAAAEADD